MKDDQDMLLLFDIDGTLTRGGPAKEAFQLGLESVFGTSGPIEDHDFSGKTDPQIARELMTRAGITREEFDARADALWVTYLTELERRIADAPVSILPGAAELVGTLHVRGEICLGLVTGNLERGALLKLGSVGLAHFFPVGGYGSDHEHRDALPPVALRRASVHWGREFAGRDAVIIGDTPRDIACGRAIGATTVAVATGRFDSETLRSFQPDVLLPDLSDTEGVLRTLAALIP